MAQGTDTAAADHMSDVVAAFEQASGAALTSLSQQAGEAASSHAAHTEASVR